MKTKNNSLYLNIFLINLDGARSIIPNFDTYFIYVNNCYKNIKSCFFFFNLNILFVILDVNKSNIFKFVILCLIKLL